MKVDKKTSKKDAEKEDIIHSLDEKPASLPELRKKKAITILAASLVLGVITGFGIATVTQQQTKTKNVEKSQQKKEEKKDGVAKTAGVKDKKLFKDEAEGVLREGGVEGEGEYHLERPGGESQNVYLTSTTVDLSEYVGQEVRVQGQTFSAEVAGWLMEVGYLEVL